MTEPVVSPDGKKVLFGISYESVEQNTSNRDLYVVNVDGTDTQRITRSEKSENNAVWIAGGEKIAFMYPVDGVAQMWVMNADGSDRHAVSSVEGGISGFLLSPDESKVVMIGNVKYARTAEDIYPDLPKATGRVVDDLMYKHWDEWVTEIPHPFVGSFDGSKVSDVDRHHGRRTLRSTDEAFRRRRVVCMVTPTARLLVVRLAQAYRQRLCRVDQQRPLSPMISTPTRPAISPKA